MHRWFTLLLAVALFSSVASFAIENDDSCSSEEKPQPEDVKVKCPKHYKGYIRTPNAANNQTKKWCIRVVMTTDSVTQSQAQSACNSEGSVLTTFASFDEQKHIVRTASRYLRHHNITNGSIWLDGSRISQCQTFNTTIQLSSPCNSKTLSFAVTDTRTDPKYALTQWYRTSPTWAYWPLRAEDYSTYPIASSVLANCVQMWIARHNSDRNGQLHNMHCDMAVPAYSYEKQLFTNYGYVCGRDPVLSFY